MKRASWRVVSGPSTLSALQKCVSRPSTLTPSISAEALEQRRSVGRRHPEAAHAGVDLDVQRHHAARGPRRRGEPARGLRLPHDRSETRLDDGREVGGVDAAEHDDRPLDARRPEVASLGGGRHGEALGSGIAKRPSDQRQAVPVSVGFHHRQHPGRAGDAPELGEIVGERPPVDFGDGRPRLQLGSHVDVVATSKEERTS